MENPRSEKRLRIASRTSPLALYQTELVRSRLRDVDPQCRTEVIPVSTKGDKDQRTSLQNLGQTGIFTKALDDALLAGQADLAVHSLKDYPTQVPKGLKLVAVLPRDGYLDAFIPGIQGGNKDEDLVVLSGSPRRRAQWLHRYPHHTFEDLRGNMHTRLDKIRASGGGIVSAPGLKRIHLLPGDAELLDWMVPAPAQGVMAVVAREDDVEAAALSAQINDQITFECAHIERQFMAAVEAGCASPLGALCVPEGDNYHFEGVLLSVDGKQRVTKKRLIAPEDWKSAGAGVAADLLAAGGAAIMAEIKALQPKDVLCLKEVQPEQRNMALELGLKLHDVEVLDLQPHAFEVVESSLFMVASAFGAEQLAGHIDALPPKAWVVGSKAVEVLENAGYAGEIRGFANSAELATAYTAEAPGSAVYYGAQRTSQAWEGLGIQHVITYVNAAKPPRLARQQWDAILALSPLGVESAFAYNEFSTHTPVSAIGPSTGAAVRNHGFERVVVAPEPNLEAMLHSLKDLFND